MLSGEGNENCEKTTIGLISKKGTLHVQHNFFVHFFAVVLHDLLGPFIRGKIRRVLHRTRLK